MIVSVSFDSEVDHIRIAQVYHTEWIEASAHRIPHTVSNNAPTRHCAGATLRRRQLSVASNRCDGIATAACLVDRILFILLTPGYFGPGQVQQ